MNQNLNTRNVCLIGGLALLTTLLSFLIPPVDAVAQQPDAKTVETRTPVKVAVIVSDDHYLADTILPQFGQCVQKHFPGIRFVTIHGHGTGDFQNVEQLPSCDLVMLFVRRIAVKENQMTIFRKYLESGQPIIAFRTASHAFDIKKPSPAGYSQWPEFDHEILGGNYHNHGPNEQGTDVSFTDAAKTHPIFASLSQTDYHSTGSLYFTAPVKQPAVILQLGSTIDRNGQRQTHPLTWARKTGYGGQVVYFGMGHWEDFQSVRFLQSILNAVCWTTNQPIPSADKTDEVFKAFAENLKDQNLKLPW